MFLIQEGVGTMSEKKLKRIVITEEFMKLTGDPVSAAILQQMLFWYEIVRENDNEIREQIKTFEKLGNTEKVNSLKGQIRDGWFYKTAKELAEDDLMGYTSRSTAGERLQKFEELGFLESAKLSPMGMDRKKYFRVNIPKIQEELNKIGYNLEGYPLYTKKKVETKKVEEKQEKTASDILLEISNSFQGKVYKMLVSTQNLLKKEENKEFLLYLHSLAKNKPEKETKAKTPNSLAKAIIVLMNKCNRIPDEKEIQVLDAVLSLYQPKAVADAIKELPKFENLVNCKEELAKISKNKQEGSKLEHATKNMPQKPATFKTTVDNFSKYDHLLDDLD